MPSNAITLRINERISEGLGASQDARFEKHEHVIPEIQRDTMHDFRYSKGSDVVPWIDLVGT